MKKTILALLALVPLCLAGCNNNESTQTSGTVDLASALIVSDEFYLAASDIGLFTLGFCAEGYEFVDEIGEESFSNFTFGEAFEGFTLYGAYSTEEGAFVVVTRGDLKTGYDYGTFKGSGITTDGGSFELRVPILPATLTADGAFYSSKKENTITLTMENAGFYSDISADDIVLGGALTDATITSITPVDDEDDESTEEESEFEKTYQSINVNFSDVYGPEEYGYITVLDSGTTYNKDLQTSFDLLRRGGELLSKISTFHLEDYLIFAFSNLTLNINITAADVSITGALAGTTINTLETVEYLDYGQVVVLGVTYPSSFLDVALEGDYADLAASFVFNENTNLEGEVVEVECFAPRPDFELTHTYDDVTKKISTEIDFTNGYFNADLTAANFSYTSYASGVEEAMTISDATFTMGQYRNTLTFSCTLPSTFDYGLVKLTIADCFIVSYSSGAESTAVDYDLYQYLA